jgi:hypothetical protein
LSLTPLQEEMKKEMRGREREREKEDIGDASS